MARPKWGTKRTCLSCGARFYDLGKDPIICPKCETEYGAKDFVTRRRSRPAPVEAKVPEKVALEPDKTDDDGVAADADDEEVDEKLVEIDDESDDDVIEDTSDLGEDDDDMAEVLEHTESDDKE